MISKADIKFIQSLKTAHGRKKGQAFVVEGPKLLEELLQSDLTIRLLAAKHEWFQQYPQIRAKDYSVEVSQSELDKISMLTSANEVLAVVDYPVQEFIPPIHDGYTLVLDTIQDPGNLGTIIRTADWFGIRNIWCSPETADLWNPKVVQASMGSVFRIRLQYLPLEENMEKFKNQLPIYGTLLQGSNIKDISFAGKGFIVIGNESKGISESLKKLISQAVYIPRHEQSVTESLNASVACGILLSHLCK